MTAAIWTAVVTYLVVMLTALAVCADSKRREKAAHPPIGIGVLDDDNPTAEALADALEEHLNGGGQLYDVIGFKAAAHPCGAVVVSLVLASDAVDEAESILRGTA